jgi:cutinase
MVSNVISTCPNTKVAMSGYSQGGQLVHNAAKLLPAATMAKLNSVVIFGDPSNYSWFEFKKSAD